MVTVKIHLNSIVSTNGALYCTINLKDFYLNTPMVRPEFMHMKLAELLKTSHESTNYKTLSMPMALSQSKSKKECMASLKQAFLRKNSSKNT
jgi:hypothetical protein